jgi:hypothetical protein
MKNEYSISGSVIIRDNRIVVNGQVVFEKPGLNASDFLQKAYEHFEFNYPKFFKMDGLCKVGFVAVELLMKIAQTPKQIDAEEIGIVFSNRNSSLDTDIRYERSTATAPSPSLFVYTLPNVLIGELCIRHQIKGEAACFIFNIFDSVFQVEYVNSLLSTGRIEKCISGWADFYNENAEAFFYLAEEQENFQPHNSSNVSKIFQAI